MTSSRTARAAFLFSLSSRMAHSFSRRPPGRSARCSFAVIPDGPQGRAGIQTGIPQVPLDPRFALRAAGDGSNKRNAFLLRRSCFRCHPGRRTPSLDVFPDAPLSHDVLPDGPRGVPFLLSSRTARRAEPGSRWASRKCHWISGSRCARPGTAATSGAHVTPGSSPARGCPREAACATEQQGLPYATRPQRTPHGLGSSRSSSGWAMRCSQGVRSSSSTAGVRQPLRTPHR